MKLYNMKQRKFAYVAGIATGALGVVLLLSIIGLTRINFSFFYAIIPISIDWGFTKFRGIRTDAYMHYIGITSMILMFLGMLLIQDFSVTSLIINMIFLYFGMRHCDERF